MRIDENGNLAAEPRPKIVVRDGLAWIQTVDEQLHLIGARAELLAHGASAYRHLEGMFRNEIYSNPPKKRKTSHTLT